MAALKIFISHSHHDNDFCRPFVEALDKAGIDNWYDEYHFVAGELGDKIQKELVRRPIFLCFLSKAAFASKWVKREVNAFSGLRDRDSNREIFFIIAGDIEEDDFINHDGWIYFIDYKRIGEAGIHPLPQAEAIRQMLHHLSQLSKSPTTSVPQQPQAIIEMIARGKDLKAQHKYREALPFFEKAATEAPEVAEAWLLCADVLNAIGRSSDALTASEHALALAPDLVSAWAEKGIALEQLDHYEQSLAAFEAALALDPDDAYTWASKAVTLCSLGRESESLAAIERAMSINPHDANNWINRGDIYRSRGSNQEALEAYAQALILDAQYTYAWANSGDALNRLNRYQDAIDAAERAITLDPLYAGAWNTKGNAYFGLGRYDEAVAAYEQAILHRPDDRVVQKSRQDAIDELQKQR